MTTPLIPKHPESGCFADWFLGDGECFKCSDWIMITIGAWSRHRWFEGDKGQIQTIQAHITYVFTSWKRIGNIRCLYEPVCVRTEDLDKAGAHLLDKAKAEVIGTLFWWCGGNKYRTKRGHCELYSKKSHIGGLADQLWKIKMLLVPMNFLSSG